MATEEEQVEDTVGDMVEGQRGGPRHDMVAQLGGALVQVGGAPVQVVGVLALVQGHQVLVQDPLQVSWEWVW